MNPYLLIFFFFLFSPIITYAQGPETLWSPTFSYTWEFANRWTFNGKVNPRFFVYDNEREAYVPKELMERTEFQFIFDYALFGANIGGGYVLGPRPMPDTSTLNIEHRFLGQYSFSFYIRAARIGNRARAEYIYFTRNTNEVRFTYQLSYDIPLDGLEINVGENYLVVSNEFLGTVTGDFIMENRFYAGIGWQLKSDRKLETGIEHRADDYFNETSHSLLLVTSFYLNK